MYSQSIIKQFYATWDFFDNIELANVLTAISAIVVPCSKAI